MALVDAQYKFKFLYVDIGSYGHCADGGVFNSCSLSAALEADSALEDDCKLPEIDIICPFVIVADDALAMKRHIVKPYSGNLSTKQQTTD